MSKLKVPVKGILLSIFTILLVAVSALTPLTTKPAAAATTPYYGNHFDSDVYTRDIASDSNGNLWYLTSNSYAESTKVNKLVIQTGAVTTYEIPTENPDSQPIDSWDIVAGSDGNMWITANANEGNDKIYKITPNGDFTEYTTHWYNPIYIIPGPDGNMWFTMDGFLVRITPSGVQTEYNYSGQLGPGLAVGSDGNIWLASGQNITKFDVISHTFTEFALPNDPALVGNGTAVQMAAGPDGNVWFSTINNSRIGYITPSGDITVFPGFQKVVCEMTFASDGNLWYTRADNNIVARIEHDGTITNFPFPVTGARPCSVTTTNNGKTIWISAPPQSSQNTNASTIYSLIVDDSVDQPPPPQCEGDSCDPEQPCTTSCVQQPPKPPRTGRIVGALVVSSAIVALAVLTGLEFRRQQKASSKSGK